MKAGLSRSRAVWGLIVVMTVAVAAALLVAQPVGKERLVRSGDSGETVAAIVEGEQALFRGALSNVDGSPVTDARIVVKHLALATQFAARSQVGGRFAVEVPAGPVQITIEHPNHATHRAREVLTLPVFRSYVLSAPSLLAGRLVAPPGNGSSSDLQAVVRLVNADGSEVASTKATNDGRFAFSDLAPANYTILAWTDGLAAAVEVSVSGGLESSVEVGLKPTRLRSVRSGAAATLEVQSGPWRSRTGEAASKHNEGRAVFDLPADVGAYARLSAPGRATTLHPLTESEPREVVTPPGGTLNGRVVDVAGVALARIPVAVTWLDSGRGQPLLQHEAVSDANGEYSFSGLQAGSHEIRVKHPSFGVLIENFQLAPGASERIVHQLEPKAYLAGRMVDVAGLPQPGERVAFAAGDFGLASGVTDAQGAFRIGPVFPGKGILFGLESSDAQATQFVAPGIVTESEALAFRVPGRSARVSLRMGDSGGAALEGVEVRVRSAQFGGHRDSYPAYLEPVARSNGSGSATLQSLPASGQDLWLSKVGYVAQRVDLDLQSAVPTMMAVLERGGGFLLKPQGELAQVVGAKGVPTCRFIVSRQGAASFPVIDRAQPCASPFSAEDLLPGSYSVRVFAGGSMVAASIEVIASQRQAVVGAWSRTQGFNGSLFKSRGQPCAGCLVRDDTRGIYTTADAQGGFRLFGYACGEQIALTVTSGADPGEQRRQFALECDGSLAPKAIELTLQQELAEATAL